MSKPENISRGEMREVSASECAAGGAEKCETLCESGKRVVQLEKSRSGEVYLSINSISRTLDLI